MFTSNSSADQPAERDLAFWAIIVLVALIVLWLLLMPMVPAIARAAINRFHLRTGSFACWAIQQPIPAMYNLANQYEVAKQVAGGGREIVESGMVNHFPIRVVSFGNGRYRLLHNREPRELIVTSSYRGQSLSSHFQIEPTGTGGFVMTQVTDAEDSQ